MRRVRFLALAAATALLPACADGPGSGAGPRPDLPAPPAPEDDSDQPVRLTYVCGNRFLIANAYSVPITVTYRVIGTEEEGSATLTAAPAEDPAFSEALIETRRRGTVEIFLEGRRVRARENGGVRATCDSGKKVLAGATLR